MCVCVLCACVGVHACVCAYVRVHAHIYLWEDVDELALLFVRHRPIGDADVTELTVVSKLTLHTLLPAANMNDRHLPDRARLGKRGIIGPNNKPSTQQVSDVR